MAKPICVIKVNMDADLGGGQRVNLWKIREYMLKELMDYHVFVLPNMEDESDIFEFQVFYEKDFTEIQYEELRKLITDSINNLKQQ